MRHAFETLKFHRVEYKTDVRNARSRAAILKLGATQEGIFRKHMIMADGHVRDLGLLLDRRHRLACGEGRAGEAAGGVNMLERAPLQHKLGRRRRHTATEGSWATTQDA